MSTIKMHLQSQSPVGPIVITFGITGTTVFNEITQLMPDLVTIAAGFCGIVVSIYSSLLLRIRIQAEKETIKTERLKQEKIRTEMEKNCPLSAHCKTTANG
ncbi:hypothetical protein [Prosthecochloris sp.]|uniref:hypothetical protein n=1 Tax=Prosthecochloris sp. TaxID=290513 RepID=UPI0025DA9E72|nr:hypothetical protein [Prosthecochloris sp.]